MQKYSDKKISQLTEQCEVPKQFTLLSDTWEKFETKFKDVQLV